MLVREAAMAGHFYPADPDKLRQDIEQYLISAEIEAAPSQVLALVAPHAGYAYSGPTAGHAYARVRGKKPTRVVLLGRSHHFYFDDLQVWNQGAFRTPLGDSPIDDALAADLAQEFGSDTYAHGPEHTLEVHVPFLQVAFDEVPVVPVLFGSDPRSWHADFGRSLAERLGPNDLIVASTDLSHFLKQEQANEIDRRSLDRVLSGEYDMLTREIAGGRCSMCGATAVVAAMAYAESRNAAEWRLLDYRTSGDATGDYARVVGYGAVSIERQAERGRTEEAA